MIITYKPGQLGLDAELVQLITKTNDKDFYITKDNKRHYIKTEADLQFLFSNCTDIYYDEENINGLIVVWKSVFNDLNRFYVKICAVDPDNARKLLTMLCWNIDKELFMKVRKTNPFLPVIQRHKFNFFGDRGSEILLKRDRITPIRYTKDKCDEYNS